MLTEDEAEEGASAGAAWASLSTTKAVAKDVQEQVKQAMALLLACAEQSSDPKVAAAYATYHAKRTFLEGFAMHEAGGKEVRLVESLKLEPVRRRA